MGAYAQESITVSSSAIGFTDSIINNGGGLPPHIAVFVVEDGDIRFTCDGTTPTASIGIPAEVGDLIEIHGETNIEAFRAIRKGSVDAVIQPQYFNGMG